MTTHTSQELSENFLDLQTPDLANLAEQVLGIIVSEESSQQQINQLLQLTVGLVNGAGALLYTNQDGVLQTFAQLLSQQATRMSSDIFAECFTSAEKAIAGGKASITPLAQMPSAYIISCPVPGLPGSQMSCLSVLVLLGDTPKEPFLVTVQLMAAIISGRLDSDKKVAAPQQSTTDFLSTLATIGKELNFQKFRDALRLWFGCSVLAIGSGRQGGTIRLKSVSDIVTVDHKTAQARLFTKIMQDCLQHNCTVAWPALHPEVAAEESLLVKELVQANGMRQGFATPLPRANDKATICVILWSDEQQRAKKVREFIHIAPLLGLLLPNLGTTGSVHLPENAPPLTPLKKKLLITVLAIALAGSVLYPAHFTLHPDCHTAPVQIHYVVARFDSFLQQVFAEPGDRVEKDAQMALLDGRELALELRSITAESAKALKLRDNHLASGNVAAAQIGLLEYKRLQERASLFGMRQLQLSLKSPVEGIVLSGDIKRAERGPVTKGQVLFEVAPLETILIELAIADADISYVQKRAPVTVRFDAFPGRSWQGEVDRISPKSELLQGKNIFIVTFQIVNSDNLLQPGMLGQASVECGKKSLLWIYFHKPWHALIRLLHSIV